MDTLDRFLIKEFLMFFVVILIGLAAIYLGIDFLSKFWNMNTPIETATMLYLYRIPATLQQFVPVACLMSTLLVLTSMSRQNEILALYCGGVSLIRIASTFVQEGHSSDDDSRCWSRDGPNLGFRSWRSPSILLYSQGG